LMQRVWIFPAEDAEFPNAQCHPRTKNHAPRVGVPQDDTRVIVGWRESAYGADGMSFTTTPPVPVGPAWALPQA